MIQGNYELARRWRVTSLGGSNVGFFLPSFLACRSIDTRYLPQRTVYTTLATNTHQANQPLTAPGVMYTSPPTCFCTCPVRHCQKNREHYSTLTYCVMECLAGPYNGKTNAKLRVHLSIVCPLTTRPCGAQPSSNPEQLLVPGMICRTRDGCDVLLMC